MYVNELEHKILWLEFDIGNLQNEICNCCKLCIEIKMILKGDTNGNWRYFR